VSRSAGAESTRSATFPSVYAFASERASAAAPNASYVPARFNAVIALFV
jgi:hypothetical protein